MHRQTIPNDAKLFIAVRGDLVLVTVPDESELIGLASRALAAGIAVSTWHEPDLGGATTAVALEPGLTARRLCANLPLHGRTLVGAAV